MSFSWTINGPVAQQKVFVILHPNYFYLNVTLISKRSHIPVHLPMAAFINVPVDVPLFTVYSATVKKNVFLWMTSSTNYILR